MKSLAFLSQTPLQIFSRKDGDGNKQLITFFFSGGFSFFVKRSGTFLFFLRRLVFERFRMNDLVCFGTSQKRLGFPIFGV
jgi:hypothetical protein